MSARDRARFYYTMKKYRNKKIDWSKVGVLFTIISLIGLILLFGISNEDFQNLVFELFLVIIVSFIISIIITREVFFSSEGFDSLMEKTNIIMDEMDQHSLEEYYITLLNSFYDYFGIYENFTNVIDSPYLQKIDTYSQLSDLFIVLEGYKNYVETSTLHDEIQTFCDIFKNFHGKLFKDLNVDDLRQLNSKMNETRKSFLKLLDNYEKQLAKSEKGFENWHRLLKMIGARDEGVPISITRISEILNIPPEEVEDTLERILLDHPDLGILFKEDQTFTKGQLRVVPSEIPDLNKLVKTKTQFCNNCNSLSSLVVRVCENCNRELPLCEICKQGYGENDKKSSCPKCSIAFHYSHFHEVIRVTGKCPVCKEELKQKDILPN